MSELGGESGRDDAVPRLATAYYLLEISQTYEELCVKAQVSPFIPLRDWVYDFVENCTTKSNSNNAAKFNHVHSHRLQW